jgi:hypothetical protein
MAWLIVVRLLSSLSSGQKESFQQHQQLRQLLFFDFALSAVLGRVRDIADDLILPPSPGSTRIVDWATNAANASAV